MTDPSPAEYRAVPLYLLREFYMDMVELTSIRSVASAADISRSTLQKFVAQGTVPHARTRRALALYYLHTKGRAECGADCRMVSVLATFWHLSRSPAAPDQTHRRQVPRQKTLHSQHAESEATSL